MLAWSPTVCHRNAENPNAQDPHCLVHCAAAPETMWVQHHNGIFVSRNAGIHWDRCTDVDPSTFGFAVAVHPHDGDTAWFVPAVKDEHRIPADGRVVVTRTRDGGRSFDKLSQGLPQVDAYDIVFRHALDVDETGGQLAFGSTTGSLWVSDNQGDNWTTLSPCVQRCQPPCPRCCASSLRYVSRSSS